MSVSSPSSSKVYSNPLLGISKIFASKSNNLKKVFCGVSFLLSPKIKCYFAVKTKTIFKKNFKPLVYFYHILQLLGNSKAIDTCRFMIITYASIMKLLISESRVLILYKKALAERH